MKTFYTKFKSSSEYLLSDKFISKDIIENRLFDESLKIGEDLIFSVGLALKKRNYGISANGLIARYNIPKLFGQRKKLNDNQKKELGRLFKLIKYSDLCYLDFKHKVKYLTKKLHYNLFF